jgi:NAD(P)H-dependent FMN reductase
MRILGISGSLRRDSYNTALLRHAGGLFEAEGAQFTLYTGLRDIPPFDEDQEINAPETVERLRAAIANADGVFFVTPEYNSSVPGVLKNALDWVSRPIATNTIRNKPVAVIGASTGGFGAVWSQALPAVGRAHQPAELDPDQEQVGVERARRDPAHVRRRRPRRETPARPRGQLEQRVELAPALAQVLASEQPARLGARIHRPIGSAHCEREDRRLGQSALDPASAAVDAAAHTALAQTGVDGVGVGRVDGEALRAAS